ncbi:hypothetical protein A5672_15710 [Mycobacterium alsense]|uniref:PE domain-containing protein n=1 Tax=Mycobacterium alsense TaxID=324058 RepID=A0ABD6P4V4_9MYCO|nr:hypothetical protein A5672_15710 [Mycobacterium alsense]
MENSVSLLVVAPDGLTSAAMDLEDIGSSVTAAHLAAAVPTTGLAAAAADEVSEAMAALFAGYGQEFQALIARAGAFHQGFLQALDSAAGAYVAAEEASAPLLNAAINDMNLLVQRDLGIYNFGDWRGWAAFALDYTWGFPGTALGYGVRLINSFYPNAGYDPGLSALAGSHVYRGGIGLPGFTTTLGNVTTHLGTGPGAEDIMLNHESVHVWQNRLFGPLFTTSYAGWMAGGFFVGTGYWLLHPNQDWFSLVETAAYYDNPWEVWAYANDNNWPPPGANPALLWPAWTDPVLLWPARTNPIAPFL